MLNAEKSANWLAVGLVVVSVFVGSDQNLKSSKGSFFSFDSLFGSSCFFTGSSYLHVTSVLALLRLAPAPSSSSTISFMSLGRS